VILLVKMPILVFHWCPCRRP